jgi:hypothetical protein
MTTVDYKILFEVRILHDYYLFGPDPFEEGVSRSYFAMNAAAQQARLQALLRRGRYDIGKDLDFLLGSREQWTFSDLRLRMIKSPTGFFIGMEVESTVQNGGAARFRPAIRPLDDATLTFGVAFSNPSFGAISNLRLDRDTQNIYYFTNQGIHDGISLSKPIGRLIGGQQYRMGDLAMVGRDSRQAIADNAGDPSFWEPLAGNGFVNQADRSLSIDEEWYRDWLLTLQSAGRPNGVIQIALKSGNGRLSPLDADGLLATRFVPGRSRPVHPVFELRFLGLATYWRYRKMDGFSDEEIKTIEDCASKVLERSGVDFVAKTPRRSARELPLLPLESPPKFFRLPNAQPGSLRAGGGKLYSEIYLSYVPITKEK